MSSYSGSRPSEDCNAARSVSRPEPAAIPSWASHDIASPNRMSLPAPPSMVSLPKLPRRASVSWSAVRMIDLDVVDLHPVVAAARAVLDLEHIAVGAGSDDRRAHGDGRGVAGVGLGVGPGADGHPFAAIQPLQLPGERVAGGPVSVAV